MIARGKSLETLYLTQGLRDAAAKRAAGPELTLALKHGIQHGVARWSGSMTAFERMTKLLKDAKLVVAHGSSGFFYIADQAASSSIKSALINSWSPGNTNQFATHCRNAPNASISTICVCFDKEQDVPEIEGLMGFATPQEAIEYAHVGSAPLVREPPASSSGASASSPAWEDKSHLKKSKKLGDSQTLEDVVAALGAPQPAGAWA